MLSRSEQRIPGVLSTRDQTRIDAAAVLERFHTAWVCTYVNADMAGIAEAGGLTDALLSPDLRDASEAVLRGVQTDLLDLESPVERKTARILMRERLWAITALIDVDGPKRAKEVLLELTNGKPLTVCMGDAYRVRSSKWEKKTVTTTVGDVGITVPGCLAIFFDSVRTDGGEMWPGFCDECRSHRRKPHRDQRREVRRLIDAARRPRNATVYYSGFVIRDDGAVGIDPALTRCGLES